MKVWSLGRLALGSAMFCAGAVAAPGTRPVTVATIAPGAGLADTGKAHALDLKSVVVPASETARTLDLGYEIRVGGLTLASMDLKAIMDGERYVASSLIATKGLADLFVSSNVQALATGSVLGRSIVPRTYNSDIQGGEKRQLVGLLFGDKGPISIDSAPAYDTRFPVSEELKLSTIDPVSGILFVALGSSASASAPCGLNVPVFDGRRRYDLKLVYESNDKISSKGVYDGPALHCVAHYQRVAGFKPPKNGRKPTVVPPIDIWLAPLAGGELLVPVRMEIDSDFGGIVARAVHLKVAGPAPQG
jgi:hypothetical protein